MTRKFKVGGVKGYYTVGLFEDGMPGELFIKMDKSADSIWTTTMGVLVSLALQRGVPLVEICGKLEYQRGDPHGPTNDPEIPMAHSIVDYIARRLKRDYCK